MKKDDVKVGQSVKATVKEDVKLAFTGTVEKIYENSALLTIDDFDQTDAAAVSELNNKIVVNFNDLKKNN